MSDKVDDCTSIDEFPLKPLTDGVDKVLKGVREWQRLLEESFDRLRLVCLNMRRRRRRLRLFDPVPRLCRAEAELTKFIGVTLNREQQFTLLISETFLLQRAEVERYFNKLPYRSNLINYEFQMILRILFDKERDLKQHVVEKMAGNRAWMQTLLDSIRTERLEWELAEARRKIEE